MLLLVKQRRRGLQRVQCALLLAQASTVRAGRTARPAAASPHAIPTTARRSNAARA
eukprot:SAG31_NODE_36994_length_308_cov_0.976077_1_plen_55_part_01